MALYIDTEFNGFNGELISLAIVSSVTRKVFYEVRELPEDTYLHPWVRQHVMPILNRPPVDELLFKAKLWEYMRQHVGEAIFADWPEDIAHLMRMMCDVGGITPRLEYSMYVINTYGAEIKPDLPHNALSDAWALHDWHQEYLDQESVHD